MDHHGLSSGNIDNGGAD